MKGQKQSKPGEESPAFSLVRFLAEATGQGNVIVVDHHGLYADRFNGKYGLDDHLWQERFYACVLDDAHLWNAVRYVEQNPVRAGLVERAEEYRWSSAGAHCGLVVDPLLDPDFPPDGLIADWRSWLADELSTKTLEQIRKATWKGVPNAHEDEYSSLQNVGAIIISGK